MSNSSQNYEFDVSIVIPCLNEAVTIAKVVAEAKQGISDSGLKGEIIVSDNGSTDGSQQLAEQAGARVVPAPLRGYGAALHYGILAARGKFVLFGDADMSYDFKLLPRFKQYIVGGQLENEKDLVLGSRLGGTIEPGAMPFLNRYLGTPVLNVMIRLFFGLATTDCNSGMRLVRRSFYEKLPMRAPGMEWASELLIKSKIMNARYAEVPITLRPDQRGRAPHLRRWRDGWRHLKSIVLLSPNRLILLPSLLALALSAVFAQLGQPAWTFVSFTVGLSGLLLGLLVKLVLHSDKVRTSRLVDGLIARPFAEALLGTGLFAVVVGSYLLVTGRSEISRFMPEMLARQLLQAFPILTISLPAMLLTLTGALLVLASFAWGVLVTHCLKTLD